MLTLIAFLFVYLPIVLVATRREMPTHGKITLAFCLGFIAYPLVISAEREALAYIEQLGIITDQALVEWDITLWLFYTALFYTLTVLLLTETIDPASLGRLFLRPITFLVSLINRALVGLLGRPSKHT